MCTDVLIEMSRQFMKKASRASRNLSRTVTSRYCITSTKSCTHTLHQHTHTTTCCCCVKDTVSRNWRILVFYFISCRIFHFTVSLMKGKNYMYGQLKGGCCSTQPALTLDWIFPLLQCKMAPRWKLCTFTTALADACLYRVEQGEIFLHLQMF